MSLATIDQLKEYLGDGADKDDTLLTRIVAAASDMIENYCGRTFASTAYTNEMYDGTGTRTLVLRHFPIIGTPTVLEMGSTLTVGTDPVSAPDVLVYPEIGQLVRPWFYWLPYRNWYKISYTAGFAAVPPVILQACLDVSALMLREKEHVGLSQKTSGVQTVTYIRKLPEQIQRGLDGYADLIIGSPN
jgi:Phage gp6-like head-tail connector protein